MLLLIRTIYRGTDDAGASVATGGGDARVAHDGTTGGLVRAALPRVISHSDT
jgi:hypothetical protein